VLNNHSLTKENGELTIIKDRMDEIEREHQAKLRELDKEKQTLVYKVRQERISQLFSDRKSIMYQVGFQYTDKPKCNECNDKREIVFLSPQGGTVKTRCKCATSDKSYVPELNVAYEISIHNIDNNTPRVWYRAKNEGKNDEYFSSETTDYCDATYSGQEYSTLDKYGTFFANKEDCQKYCDYLNKKEE
jgi:hypothetical protein